MFGLVNPDNRMFNSKKEFIGLAIIEVADQQFPVASPLYWVESPTFNDGDVWIEDQQKIANVKDFEAPVQARKTPGRGPNVL